MMDHLTKKIDKKNKSQKKRLLTKKKVSNKMNWVKNYIVRLYSVQPPRGLNYKQDLGLKTYRRGVPKFFSSRNTFASDTNVKV